MRKLMAESAESAALICNECVMLCVEVLVETNSFRDEDKARIKAIAAKLD